MVLTAQTGRTSQLFVRSFAGPEIEPLEGTEGGTTAFFSPDGGSVGFFVERELKRLSLDTGEVRTVSVEGPAFTAYGASWTARDTILLTAGPAVYEVPANGGRLSRVTSPDPGTEATTLYPELLPDGETLLYNVQSSVVPSEWDIVVEVHLRGTYLATKAAWAQFLDTRRSGTGPGHESVGATCSKGALR